MMFVNIDNDNPTYRIMDYIAVGSHEPDTHGGYYSDYPILGKPYYIKSKSSGLYLTPKDALPYPLLAEKPLIADNAYQKWTFVGTASNPGCYAMNMGNSDTITSSLVDPDLYVLGMNDLVTQFWLFGLTSDKSTYALANMRGDVIRLMTCPDSSSDEDMFIVDYTGGSYLDTQLFIFEDA